MKSNFLVIDKPKGITSRQLCNIVQKNLNIKKVGHSGTLDPFATGLMIVGIGNATKLFPYINSSTKTYTGIFRVGIETDTLDITGSILIEKEANVSLDELNKASKKFLGNIEQRVPDYSASKVEGKRRYKMAREGISLPDKYVKREVKNIEIKMISKYDFSFKVTVSNGTYIRQLFYDITSSIGCPSTLVELRREAIGEINISYSQQIEEPFILLELDKIVKFKNLLLPNMKKDFSNGKELIIDGETEELIFASDEEGIYALLEKKEELYKVKKGM